MPPKQPSNHFDAAFAAGLDQAVKTRASRPTSLTHLSDGGWLVGGDSSVDGDRARRWFVLRFSRDGVVDADWRATENARHWRGSVDDLAGLADGTLVIGGRSGGSKVGSSLVRFTIAGDLDPAFGNAGTVDLGARFGSGRWTILSASGEQILIAHTTPSETAVLALDSHGRHVKSFARRGVLRLAPSFATVSSRGRIWVARRTAANVRVERYLRSGQPDSSYVSQDRTVAKSLPKTDSGYVVQSLKPLGDGGVQVAVKSETDRLHVFRLGPDGGLEQKFGENGTVNLEFPFELPDAEIDSHGNAVCVAQASSSYSSEVFMIASSGKLAPLGDSSLLKGVRVRGSSSVISSVTDAELDVDESLVVVGVARDPAKSGETKMFFQRLLLDGESKR
jgi:hypothetical protein